MEKGTYLFLALTKYISIFALSVMTLFLSFNSLALPFQSGGEKELINSENKPGDKN